MEYGELSVTTAGTTRMQKWCVSSWAFMELLVFLPRDGSLDLVSGFGVSLV